MDIYIRVVAERKWHYCRYVAISHNAGNFGEVAWVVGSKQLGQRLADVGWNI